MTATLLAAAPDVDITSTSTGVPWWTLVIVAAITAAGGAFATWVTRRRDRASNEQTLIDQLQQEVSSLRKDLTSLQSEVRTMRVREIGWIRYTAELVRRVLQLGGEAPPMPAELANDHEESPPS